MSDAIDKDALEKITAARAKARVARLRLMDDVALLRDRAQPTLLAGEAVREVAERVWVRPAAVLAGATLLGLSVAMPRLRRWGFVAGRILWRNRAPIGRFIMATLPAARRMDRKER